MAGMPRRASTLLDGEPNAPAPLTFHSQRGVRSARRPKPLPSARSSEPR